MLGALQNRPEHRFRLAVGSFIEEYQNRIEIITCARDSTSRPHPLFSANSSSGPVAFVRPRRIRSSYT